MSEPIAPLVCPKCGGDMRRIERSGVVIDQCTQCRGVFLDRGELERLMDAEGAYYEREREPAPSEPRPGEPPKKRKRMSFLSDLMEGVGE